MARWFSTTWPRAGPSARWDVGGDVGDLAFSPDGRKLAVSLATDPLEDQDLRRPVG